MKKHKGLAVQYRAWSLLILLALTLQASAAGYAQKVSIHQQNTDLKTILNSIRKQTGYYFIYTKAVIQKAKPVTIDVTNQSISDVLNLVLKDQHLSYEIKDKVIIITQSPVIENNITAIPPVDVKGKISDSKGESLIGASVRVKGSSKGAITDVNGNFTISGIEDNAVLVVSYAGYVTQEIPLGGQSQLNIILKDDVKGLNDVVVVGYGSMKKS